MVLFSFFFSLVHFMMASFEPLAVVGEGDDEDPPCFYSAEVTSSLVKTYPRFEAALKHYSSLLLDAERTGVRLRDDGRESRSDESAVDEGPMVSGTGSGVSSIDALEKAATSAASASSGKGKKGGGGGGTEEPTDEEILLSLLQRTAEDRSTEHLTLAKRGQFFRSELEHYLELCAKLFRISPYYEQSVRNSMTDRRVHLHVPTLHAGDRVGVEAQRRLARLVAAAARSKQQGQQRGVKGGPGGAGSGGSGALGAAQGKLFVPPGAITVIVIVTDELLPRSEAEVVLPASGQSFFYLTADGILYPEWAALRQLHLGERSLEPPMPLVNGGEEQPQRARYDKNEIVGTTVAQEPGESPPRTIALPAYDRYIQATLDRCRQIPM